MAVKVRLNAAAAPKDKDNKAVIVIKSNDLYNPILNYPIYLSKNAAPVVTVPSEVVYAKEADSTIVNVVVVEPEGDDMTIAIANSNEMVSIKGVTADNNEAQVTIGENNIINVVGETQSVNVEIVIAPAYETAGSYSFDIIATDNANHEAKATLRYYVEHVNRAPEVVDSLSMIELAVNSASAVVSLDEFFADPDGDEMTYAITLSDESVATMFVSGNDVIFMGKTVGEAVATITATDANGAQTIHRFVVKVSATVGIGGVAMDGNVTVGPNPAVETIYVTCNFSSDAATYALYDYSGKQMYFCTEAVSVGTIKAINVSGYAPGLYILKVATEEGSFVHHIVKK